MAIQPGRFVISLDRGDWWCQYAVVQSGRGLDESLAWLKRSRKGQDVMIFDRWTGKTAIHRAERWPDEIVAFCSGNIRYASFRVDGLVTAR